MTIPYGGTPAFPERPDVFKCSIFLVLMNRLVTVCISAVGEEKGEAERNRDTLYGYFPRFPRGATGVRRVGVRRLRCERGGKKVEKKNETYQVSVTMGPNKKEIKDSYSRTPDPPGGGGGRGAPNTPIQTDTTALITLHTARGMGHGRVRDDTTPRHVPHHRFFRDDNSHQPLRLHRVQ